MTPILSLILHVLLFVALYFEVLLLIAFLGRFPRARRAEPRDPADLPSVTIVVPCHNEERTAGKTIASLLALRYPAEKLSIVAVDDGSTDGTLEVLRSYESAGVRVIAKENGGKHSALNAALAEATTDLIGCLDADSFADPEALARIVAHFDDPAIAAVTPAIRVHEPQSVLELVQKAEYGLSIFVRKAFGFLDAIFITPGPLSVFRRSALAEIGGFREAHNTEDLEIGLRLQSRGWRIANAHDAYVATVPPKTLRALIRQRVRWTYGFLKNAGDYRFMFFRRRYGALGLLVLPTVTLSVFSALFFFGFLLWRLGSAGFEKAREVAFAGLSASTPAFDWFFLNTNSAVFIILTLLLLTLALLAIGKFLARERMVSLDVALYFFLYGFIAPLWLARAVMNVALSRRESWK